MVKGKQVAKIRVMCAESVTMHTTIEYLRLDVATLWNVCAHYLRDIDVHPQLPEFLIHKDKN